MERELMFKAWLQKWQPKNATVNFNKNSWQENTLLSYMNVLKNIVADLDITDTQVKKNLFDYGDSRMYFSAYKKIINHPKFKTLQYFPTAKKSLNRYLEFLQESK